MSGINLLYPVMAALVILMPLNPGLLLEGRCLSRYLALAAAFRSILLTRASLRVRPGSCFYWYFGPLPASSALGVARWLCSPGQSWGIYMPPVFAFVMPAIGGQRMDLLLRPVRLPVHRIGYATGRALKVLSGTRTGLLPCCGSTRRPILAPRRGVLE
jgi:hypothetical protein